MVKILFKINTTLPTVELDNAIWFRLWQDPLQGVSGTCDTVPNTPTISIIVSFKIHQGLECQHVALTLTQTDLNGITMLFIHTGTSESWQSHIIRKKAYLLFQSSKQETGNEVGLRLHFLKQKLWWNCHPFCHHILG